MLSPGSGSLVPSQYYALVAWASYNCVGVVAFLVSHYGLLLLLVLVASVFPFVLAGNRFSDLADVCPITDYRDVLICGSLRKNEALNVAPQWRKRPCDLL